MPGVARVDAAPNGYLNVFLDRPAFLLTRLGLTGSLPAAPPHPEKTIVEHTAINPNKAAHIGHLRNSALGDTLVRALRFRGNPVEVQNYIDDPGCRSRTWSSVFQHLEHIDLAGATRIAASTRLTIMLGPLRARHRWYAGNKERLAIRGATLHDIEHGVQPTASLAAFIADTVVRAHRNRSRLNIDYHLLTWEGDILRLHFWARAFEVLKQTGAVFLQTGESTSAAGSMKIDPSTSLRAGDPMRHPPKSKTDDPEAARKSLSVQRYRRLRRQGHGLAVSGSPLLWPRLPLPPVREREWTARRCGRPPATPRTRSPSIRRSATPPPRIT